MVHSTITHAQNTQPNWSKLWPRYLPTLAQTDNRGKCHSFIRVFFWEILKESWNHHKLTFFKTDQKFIFCTLDNKLLNSCGYSFCTCPSCSAADLRTNGVDPFSNRRNSLSSLQIGTKGKRILWHQIALLMKVVARVVVGLTFLKINNNNKILLAKRAFCGWNIP